MFDLARHLKKEPKTNWKKMCVRKHVHIEHKFKAYGCGYQDKALHL
jgi:hypothetical protein